MNGVEIASLSTNPLIRSQNVRRCNVQYMISIYIPGQLPQPVYYYMYMGIKKTQLS